MVTEDGKLYAKMWSSFDVKGGEEVGIINDIEINYLHE